MREREGPTKHDFSMKLVCLNRLVQGCKRHLLYINTSLKKTSEAKKKFFLNLVFHCCKEKVILNVIKENGNSC